MKRILFRVRFPVLFLLLLGFAGCQKAAEGPRHLIKMTAAEGVSRSQFDTALQVLSKRLREIYAGDVTVRAEGETILLEVAGRPNLDSLALVVLSRGGFGMYEMYNNTEVVLPAQIAEAPLNSLRSLTTPGSAELAYATADDTTRIRKLFLESNPLLYNVTFIWGGDDVYRKNIFPLYALKRSSTGKPIVTKQMIDTAKPSYDERGTPSVSITLKSEYTHTWLKVTRDNIGRSIAIRFSNQVLSAPRVVAEIPGGKMDISGHFTRLQARMLAAIIATPDLEAALQINYVDTALFVPLRGYPTLQQQARYEMVQSEFIRLRPQIDSLLAGTSLEQQSARQEMDRIYREDILTIAANTHASRAEVDDFIVRMEVILTSLKNRLNGGAGETDLKQMLETKPAP